MKNLKLAIILIAVALSGCASQTEARKDRLYFHAAVIPMDLQLLNAENSPMLESNSKPNQELQIQLEQRPMTLALREALERECFSQATILSYPQGKGLDDFHQLSKKERNAYWMEQARSIGADLLLSSELSYQSQIEQDRNNQFYLNLPLFLLGGPFCYFVPDQSYASKANLTWSLYDMNALAQRDGNFKAPEARLLADPNAKAPAIHLNFLDRTEKNWGKYFLSLIVPSGLLSKDGPVVETAVERELANQLAADVVNRIRTRSDDIWQAPALVNFFIEPASVKVTRNSANKLMFEADVIVWNASAADSMDHYEFNIGEQEPTLVDFSKGEKMGNSDDRYVHRIQQELAITNPKSPKLQVSLTDASASESTRTFSFPIPSWSVDDVQIRPATAKMTEEKK